jgi:two-component sensor histidine kinase
MNSQIVHLHPAGRIEFAMIREANHRVANHLAILASLIQAQASKLSQGPAQLSCTDVQAILRETASKVVGVGHLHRTLSGENFRGAFELGQYLIESSQALIKTLSLDAKVGLVHRLGALCHVKPELAQPVALILNEIIMNAIKHAHPTGIPVEISILCDFNQQGRMFIEIEDDGVGLPENFDPRSHGGTGFHLIRALAASIGAQLNINSDSLGTQFRITLPAAARSA